MSTYKGDHSFDPYLAGAVGVNAAILFKNISFWVSKNEANKQQFHDGKYWTYNSIRSFKKQFDYMGLKVIRGCLNKLINEGWIEVADLSEEKSHPYFYTIGAIGERYLKSKEKVIDTFSDSNQDRGVPKGHRGVPKGHRGVPKGHRGVPKGHRGVPKGHTNDINKDIYINTKIPPLPPLTQKENNSQKARTNTEPNYLFNGSPPEWFDPLAWQRYIAHRKKIRKPLSAMTEQGIRSMLAKDILGAIQKTGLSMMELVDYNERKGYQGFFSPKGVSNHNGEHRGGKLQRAMEALKDFHQKCETASQTQRNEWDE